ncbi:hypothetical protein [Bradyrhizobium sp. Tv2a-2]|uniref:hypothetical protein n=1 Tax=Bradyrhizobium sp. Tv2a-2 TaxID=113395 RepID=UPI000406D9BE|nr:hypothetical protein [Bradyrhizobium sp. Tv2a-2]
MSEKRKIDVSKELYDAIRKVLVAEGQSGTIIERKPVYTIELADAVFEYDTRRDDYPKYMMATTAIHLLGDISSDTPDICHIEREEGDDYIGAWVTGFGFINVRFPKATTRDLTPEEVEKYDGKQYRIGSQPSFALRVRK